MPKKKILLVITQGQWGGAQRYVYDLAVNLAKSFDVVVAVGETDGVKDLQAKLNSRGIQIIQLRHLRRSISPWHDVLAIFEMARLYRNQQADIIHLNSSKAGILGSFAKLMDSRLRGNDSGATVDSRRSLPSTPIGGGNDNFGRGNDGIKIVYTVHGWVFEEPMTILKRWLYIQLEKFTAKMKDKIIVLSKKELETAKNILNISEQKLAIISHGIAPIEKKYIKEEAREILLKKINDNSQNLAKIKNAMDSRLRGNDSGATVDSRWSLSSRSGGGNDSEATAIWFGAVANFYQTKGLDILLNSAALQKEKLKNAHFILIGDGPEKNKLLKIIEKNNLKDNIHMTGWIENATSLIPAFDYFILPSRKEGYPYAILEAAMQKIPIIAAAVGGIPEIIEDKKTGILVEKENARELSEAIIFALNNPERMKEFAENAFSMARMDGSKIMTDKTISLYSSLMNYQP